jgi:uncharacterized protein (TIGR03435 family)
MAEKLYKFLLKLYPDHFRRTYGDEALRLVRDRARSENGFLSGLRLWLDLLLDLAISLPSEYSNARAASIVAAQPLNGERSFQLLAERPLDPTLLCLGGTLSAALFWVCVFVVAHCGGFPALFPASLSAQKIEQSTPAQDEYSFCMTAQRDIPSNSVRPLFVFNFAHPGASGVARIDGRVVKIFKNEQRLSIRAHVIAGDHQFVLRLDKPAETTSMVSNNFEYSPAKIGANGVMTDFRGILRLAAAAMLLYAGPTFEVTSIKRHTAESGPVQLGPTPEGFRAIGLPMGGIFQWAYALPNQPGLLRGDQIEGDPGWLSTELYDVVAKVGHAEIVDWQKPAIRQTMLRAMLQAMLAERRRVVAHYRTKEAPVYDLLIAKGGPKFKQAETVDTAELRRKHPDGGIMRGSGTMGVPSPNGTQFYAISMAILANTILPSVTDRPVVDKTGLTGYYDLVLPSSALRRPLPLDAPSPSLEEESIFGALEALGLRLAPAKGQVEMLVIDHLERPSEN